MERTNRHEPSTRIAVTGVGAVCAAGIGCETVWEGLMEARPTVRGNNQKTLHGSSIETPCPLLSAPCDLGWQLASSRERKASRIVQMALVAAREAIRQSRLADPHSSGSSTIGKVGVSMATARGPVDRQEAVLHQSTTGRVRPALAADLSLASLSGSVAQAFHLTGPAFTTAATCSSGAAAIALAADQILLGRADAMVVGAAEAPLEKSVWEPFQSAGVLAASAAPPENGCRPFCRDRTGMVLGEGAAVLVLESETFAARRQIPPLAWLSGWALGNEATDRTAPRTDGEGLYTTMDLAFERAGRKPEEIDFILTHGTGTELNDRLEAWAMQRKFGLLLESIPCGATKPVTGHCLGASSALETVFAVQMLNRQWALPSMVAKEADPEFGLHFLESPGQQRNLRAVLCNSQGFWGHHATLLLDRF